MTDSNCSLFKQVWVLEGDRSSVRGDDRFARLAEKGKSVYFNGIKLRDVSTLQYYLYAWYITTNTHRYVWK